MRRFSSFECVHGTWPVSFAHIHDFSAGLAGANTFGKIGLIKACHRVPVEPAHVPKTAITTPFRLFDCTRMPFGLWNFAQAFPCLISEVTRELEFVFAYVDDILVASSQTTSATPVRPAAAVRPCHQREKVCLWSGCLGLSRPWCNIIWHPTTLRKSLRNPRVPSTYNASHVSRASTIDLLTSMPKFYSS